MEHQVFHQSGFEPHSHPDVRKLVCMGKITEFNLLLKFLPSFGCLPVLVKKFERDGKNVACCMSKSRHFLMIGSDLGQDFGLIPSYIE